MSVHLTFVYLTGEMRLSDQSAPQKLHVPCHFVLAMINVPRKFPFRGYIWSRLDTFCYTLHLVTQTRAE